MQINFPAHLIVSMFCLRTLNTLHETVSNDTMMGQ